jgi:hypothetical protein
MRLDVMQLQVRVFTMDGLVACYVRVVGVVFRRGGNADPCRNATRLIQLDHGRRHINTITLPPSSVRWRRSSSQWGVDRHAAITGPTALWNPLVCALALTIALNMGIASRERSRL